MSASPSSARLEGRNKKQMSSPESVVTARQCSFMSSTLEDSSPGSTPELQHLWAHGSEPFRPKNRTPDRPSRERWIRDRGQPFRKRLVLAKLTHHSWPTAPSG
ncbi:hypothetical protein BaRGS_00000663 [Batillaria attramentaria]|uniref:Uncharacterized protein n=1 Tax=Batillaria attramentaria TaxID=370345 RepID=A0ABD0M9C2_9CAEN